MVKVLTDEEARGQLLRLHDRNYAGVAGRLYDSHEALRADRDAHKQRIEALEAALREIRGQVTVAIEAGGNYPEYLGHIHGIATCALMEKGPAGREPAGEDG